MGNNLMIKYIVYETRNLVNQKIYIGVHRTPTPYTFDGYLGCGVINTQPYTYENAKTAFQYAVKKYGPKNFFRTTLAVFDTFDDALDLERWLVTEDFINREDTYNMCLGGFGGYYESVRQTVYQYSLDGMYLAEYESYYQAAVAVGCQYQSISRAVLNKGKCMSFLWSLEKVYKLDTSEFILGNAGRTEISVYDNNGAYIETLPSLKATSEKYYKNDTGIREAIQNGTLLRGNYYCYHKAERFDVARKKYLDARPVYKYNSDGLFVKEYKSQKLAELDNPESNISKALRLKSCCENNYLWSLVKSETYTVKKKNVKKPVEKRTLSGDLIKTYESATAAVKENGPGVWEALHGHAKTCKNHTYNFI